MEDGVQSSVILQLQGAALQFKPEVSLKVDMVPEQS
jgi:hypothetical protein